MKQQEFDALLADTTKHIDDDIKWRDDDDHYPSFEFRVDIRSEAHYPLFVRGSYNPIAQTLTYVLIHKRSGRIYGLDMGKVHRNPSGELVGKKHKHRWDEMYKDKDAYEPKDITALVTEPVKVWSQFCKEASIIHNGVMNEPPALQMELY